MLHHDLCSFYYGSFIQVLYYIVFSQKQTRKFYNFINRCITIFELSSFASRLTLLENVAIYGQIFNIISLSLKFNQLNQQRKL